MPFTQTALFQLNFVIHLSLPTGTTGLRPIFWDNGFSLYAIGPLLTTTLQAQARAANAKPPIPLKAACAPDILLQQDHQKLLVPLECKLRSFGPERSPADQAAALLSMDGPQLADTLGLSPSEDWSAATTYIVSGGQEADMKQTLTEISQILNTARIETVSSHTLGISVRSDGVYIQIHGDDNILAGLIGSSQSNDVRVLEMDEDDDPRPLYLIPLDPSIDGGDEYGKDVLRERVRAALASIIGSRLDEQGFEFSLDDILRTAIEVWDIWQDRPSKAHLRTTIRAYVLEVLQSLGRLGMAFDWDSNRATIRNVTPSTATEVRRHFRSVSYRRGQLDLWPDSLQLDFWSEQMNES